MRSVKTYPVILLLVMAAACEKDFPMEERPDAKKMTVNCLFDNYGIFRVYLTESSSALHSSDIMNLTDATVSLYENGSYRETLQYVASDSLNTFGSYRSLFKPLPGKTYAVEVSHQAYGLTTAEDIIPPVTPITSASLITMGDYLEQDDAIFDIEFNDDDAAENFYRINTWLSYTQKVFNPDTIATFTSGIYIDQEESLSDSVRDNGWALLFSDKNFNGQHRKLTLHFEALQPWLITSSYEVILHIDLNTVSRAHFEYFRTLDDYRQSYSDDMERPIVYSNIENGYGIFAGSAVSTVEIRIK